jgi:hypothetical protein
VSHAAKSPSSAAAGQKLVEGYRTNSGSIFAPLPTGNAFASGYFKSSNLFSLKEPEQVARYRAESPAKVAGRKACAPRLFSGTETLGVDTDVSGKLARRIRARRESTRKGARSGFPSGNAEPLSFGSLAAKEQ